MKKKLNMTSSAVVCFLALVCCLLWGSAFSCIKIGYKMFQIDATDAVTQILFAGYRFALAGVIAITIGSVLSKKLLLPKKGSISKICILSLFQTVLQYVFFYIGLAHASGVKSSIIGASSVFISILAASLIFRLEKLTSRKIAGCLVGLLGVVLININGSFAESGFFGEMNFLGEGFILISTVASAFATVCIKKFSKDENPVVLSGYQFIAGGIIMIVCGLMAGGKLTGFTIASTGMLLYMACISAVAYSLWGILLKNNPVSKVSVYGFMNPVFGVLLAAWLLGETEQAFRWQSMVALICVSIGIYVVNRASPTSCTDTPSMEQ